MNQTEYTQVTFRFKLVYTSVTCERTINIPCSIQNLDYNQFMNLTESVRNYIINTITIPYEIVVCGQPNSEQGIALQPNDVETPFTTFSINNSSCDYISLYIRPTDQNFCQYLRDNCPNDNIQHNLGVADAWEIYNSCLQEGAQADTDDDDDPSVAEPEIEPTCENMNLNPIPTQNNIDSNYNGQCCICLDSMALSDHWQCYIPTDAQRHGVCDDCFNRYQNSSSNARNCPVCRQPLGETNYNMVAPDNLSTINNHSSSSFSVNDEPEPQPTAYPDFHFGGSGAAGGQDSEHAAGPPELEDDDEHSHFEVLQQYSSYGSVFNNITNDTSFNNLTTSTIHDLINYNTDQSIPHIEVRNQEIIIRNIPYNEMINLQNHNPHMTNVPGYYNNNSSTYNNTNESIRNELLNIVTNQINSIASDNRLNINIFNSSLNEDNNLTSTYQS